MKTKIICKHCGTVQPVSRNGWFVTSKVTGRLETKYFEWIHVVGHWGRNKKRMCPGSGGSPRFFQAA